MRLIEEVAADLELSAGQLMPCGDAIAKVRLAALPKRDEPLGGRIVLVSAINPTKAG